MKDCRKKTCHSFLIYHGSWHLPWHENWYQNDPKCTIFQGFFQLRHSLGVQSLRFGSVDTESRARVRTRLSTFFRILEGADWTTDDNFRWGFHHICAIAWERSMREPTLICSNVRLIISYIRTMSGLHVSLGGGSFHNRSPAGQNQLLTFFHPKMCRCSTDFAAWAEQYRTWSKHDLHHLLTCTLS